MIDLSGEYECRLDERGRLKLPAKLIESLGELGKGSFIINRGFEKNLAIYPKLIWDQKTKEINQLNIYDKEHRAAIRYFYRGATVLTLDSAGRVNIPSNILLAAGIEKDVILFAYRDIIELWSAVEYNLSLEKEPDSFADIIQRTGLGRKSDDFYPGGYSNDDNFSR
jgi:MraZ protein